MKVSDLLAKLSTLDPNAIVVVDGFETALNPDVAEVDCVVACETVAREEHPLYGTRQIKPNSGGASSVWIGWSKDYRGTPAD